MSEWLEIVRARLGKVEKLKEKGIAPYPADAGRTHLIGSLLRDAEKLSAGEGISEQKVKISGRLRALREHGKVCFGVLEDASGAIQLYFRRQELGEATWEIFWCVDVGDFLEICGFPFKTKTGEPTIHVETFRVLSKSLHPLPEKRHGLVDTELRHRRRYADLLSNREVKDVFRKRSLIIREVRHALEEKGYLEVETPVLHPLAGGAAARPFITHHHALDMELYLRIAPELYLKRLLVGGFEKVFEIGRNFRNEGISTKHNPEFTMLEAYEAFGSGETMMQLTEELLVRLWNVAGASRSLPRPIPRLSIKEALKKYEGLDSDRLTQAEAEVLLRKEGLAEAVKLCIGKEEMLYLLFEEKVEKKLEGAVFITDFPASVSPLAKPKKGDPAVADRFELFLDGMEVANGFSELNDPLLQKERFEEQMKRRSKGDKEAMPYDEDYLRALALGMPPAGGVGIGIDRLVLWLTGASSIRDVILFPLLRPRSDEEPLGF